MRPRHLDNHPALVTLGLIVAGALICLAMMVTIAFAQTPNAAIKQNRCLPLGSVITTIDRLPAKVRSDIQIVVFAGEKAQAWATAFNALPPQSNVELDRVMIAVNHKQGIAVYAMEWAGCVIAQSRMPIRISNQILKTARLGDIAL